MTSNRPYLLRAVYEWICDNNLTPYIVVDASRPGLQVPPQAVADGRVVLNLAPRAVARLEIGNEAVTCTARFGGVSHSLHVPVAAVQAIYAHENGQGMLMAEESQTPQQADAAPAPASDDSGQPALQAVPTADQDGAADEPDDASSDKPDPDKPRGKPSLRVIK